MKNMEEGKKDDEMKHNVFTAASFAKKKHANYAKKTISLSKTYHFVYPVFV